MNCVDMGFVEKCESWKLQSRFFPNKVGGKPAWLDLKHLPTAKSLECSYCHDPCTFLCQIYAPYDDNINAFHRTIFIFICKKSGCCKSNENGNLHVLRSQLPRENEFYPFDPPIEKECWKPEIIAENFARLCRICSLSAPSFCARCKSVNYCSRQHQVLDWKHRHKAECQATADVNNRSAPSIINADHSELFPEFELVIESDTILDDDNDMWDIQKENEEMNKYAKLLENGEAGTFQSRSDVDEDLSKMSLGEDDDVFIEFKNAIQHYPSQVLRYNRGGSVLYISQNNQATGIPNCEKCNGERQFEFQIMPQLLNHLTLDNVADSLDWGVLAIFTCKNSCDLATAYHPEYVWKQDIV